MSDTFNPIYPDVYTITSMIPDKSVYSKPFINRLGLLRTLGYGATRAIPVLNAYAVAHDLGAPFIKLSIESFNDLVHNNGRGLAEKYAPLREYDN